MALQFDKYGVPIKPKPPEIVRLKDGPPISILVVGTILAILLHMLLAASAAHGQDYYGQPYAPQPRVIQPAPIVIPSEPVLIPQPPLVTPQPPKVYQPPPRVYTPPPVVLAPPPVPTVTYWVAKPRLLPILERILGPKMERVTVPVPQQQLPPPQEYQNNQFRNWPDATEL